MKRWIVFAVVAIGIRVAAAGTAVTPGPEPLRAQAEAAVAARDFPRAFKLFQKAAEKGDAVAQYRVANALFNGGVVLKNPALAEQWYLKSAEKGYAPAETMLGRLLLQRKDFTRAAQWFRKAADQGHTQGQVFLGYCFIYGRGVPRDAARGLQWIRAAADAGDVEARTALAKIAASQSKPLARRTKALIAILLLAAVGAGVFYGLRMRR